MQFDVRSSLLAAIAMVIAIVSAQRIGGYTLVGMMLLLVALLAGMIAVSMRSDRAVVLPALVGRGCLAVGVLLATILPRLGPQVPSYPHTIAHAVLSGLLMLYLIRVRSPVFADVHPVIAMAGLVLPCQAACWDGIAYPEPDSHAYRLVPWVALALYAVMGVAVTRPVERLDRRVGARVLLALLVLGGGVRLVGVVASPDPVVDVWSWRRDAPNHLLRGTNPYGAEYPDVYAMERARPHGLFNPDSPGSHRDLATYPPLPVYLSVPFAVVGLDVRYADVCFDLLAAGMIAAAGYAVRNRAVGIVAAGIYLGYPFAARVIEQSWYEPMLAGMFGAGLVLLKRGYRVGGFVLGLGLVGKQFGLMIAPAAVVACRRSWRSVAVGLVAAAVVSLGVFLVWDAQAFLNIVLFYHVRMDPRLDSLTITSLLYQEFGLRSSNSVLWLGMLGVWGYVVLRTPPCPLAGATGMGLSLYVFCLFNLQANFNYYYLCAYLLLLGLVGLAPVANRDDPSRQPAQSELCGVERQNHGAAESYSGITRARPTPAAPPP